MKKFLSLILVLSMIFVFASCTDKKTDGGKEDNPAPAKETVINLVEVKDKIIADLELSDPLELDKNGICEIRGIDMNDMDEAYGVNTLDGVFPDEIILIKAKDGDAKKRITDILNDHIKDVTNQAQNYDAESFALLQECKVCEKGDYIALFISAKHTQMEQIFEDAAK